MSIDLTSLINTMINLGMVMVVLVMVFQILGTLTRAFGGGGGGGGL
ncbi:MAG: hypothetical protein L7H04_00280 [Vulcanisaeta sp.]|nr:hypothetical protein [Vulcanisaeta sp.]